MDKTHEINGLLIRFIHNPRAKQVKLVVKPDDIRVVMPPQISFTEAKAIVLTKMDWIKIAIDKVAKRTKRPYLFTPDKDFTTYHHQFKITPSDVAELQATINEQLVTILVPETQPITSTYVQQFIRKAINITLKTEAKAYLPDRLKDLAKRHQFTYGKVSLRNNKMVWGSCSGQNNISLNIQLMRLPKELIDYVLLHELAHTKVKNHSHDFWQTLEAVCPGAKTLDKAMKDYSPQI